MHSTRALYLACSLALLASACGDDDKGPRALGGGCRADADCTAGLACELGVCQQPCAADVDCPGAERCLRGLEVDDAGTTRRVCQTAEQEACTSAVNCLGRRVCGGGECRDECTSARQCGTGQTCAANHCYSQDPNKDQLPDGGT